jgi:hypothetical protein
VAPDADKAIDGTARERADKREAGRTRKLYVAPELIEYGSVAKLTQTGGKTVTDFIFFRRMRTCL